MAADKNSLAITQFFTKFFHYFPKLILTNLIFAVPFAVIAAIFYLVNTLCHINSFFFLFLAIIPIFPFYAGVTQVISHMVRGEENVSVWGNFLNGFKDNFLKFILHGIVLYIAMVFSYFSIPSYFRFAQSSGVFYILFAISIIIALFFLFAFFYIPPMTVTFDLSVKNIYKNSALMTFGEIKRNIIALFGLFILSLFCATLLFCSTNGIVLLIVTAVLALLILPSVGSYIINSAVYANMYRMIVSGQEKIEDIDRKIENRRKGQLFDDEPEKPFVPQEFNDIEVDDTKDGDEFIFFNGKMVKRSVLVEQKRQSESKENK